MAKMPESTAETNPALARQLAGRKAMRDPREAMKRMVKVEDTVAQLLHNARRLEESGVVLEDGTALPPVDVAAIKAANDVYLKLLDKLVPSLKAVEHSVDGEAASGWQLVIIPPGTQALPAQAAPEAPGEAQGPDAGGGRGYPWE